MKLQGDLKSLTIRSIIWFSVILLVCLNFEYIVTQALEGAVWYQIPLVAIIVVLGIRLNIESENDAYSSIEMALILVVFISSWILFGVIHGFNSFSFHILHPMLVLLAYYVRKPSLGNWVFSIGNVTAIFAYQLRDINIYSIMLYMFILLGVFIHLAHVQMIMTSKRKLHKKVDELETLYAITKVLDSFPDLESVLQQITRIVTYGIGVDVCAVMLYSQETGKLELQARYPNNASKYSISPESGLAGEVFRTGQPIVCGDLNQNLELLERIKFQNDENAIGIFPLEHHEIRFGVLLFTKKTAMHIDSGIMQVMSAVASTVSMVISNAMHHETVARSAQMDDLTGLYNRSYFYRSLEHEVRKAKFTGQSVYVLVLDIDKFKKVNDTYGHLTGDRILECIGQIISTNTRKSDISARYGGEEFALILPNSCYTAAEHLAERIRRSVEKLTVESDEFSEIGDSITLSVGIACYPHCAQEPKQIVDMADKRMYAAKRTGGNQYIYES